MSEPSNDLKAGEAMNEVVIGEAIEFNGTDLILPENGTISWSATNDTQTKSGTIVAAKRTCTETRITTAADVLSELVGSGWDGATIVFTVQNGNKKAIKSAILRVAQ